jgi:hypothetical protein
MALIKDKASIEWIRVKEHSEKRLAELRADNDIDLDEVETATIRGMIRFAKEIIDLDKVQPEIPTAAGTKYY